MISPLHVNGDWGVLTDITYQSGEKLGVIKIVVPVHQAIHPQLHQQ